MSESVQEDPELAGYVASFEQQHPELASHVNRIGGPSALSKLLGTDKNYSGFAGLANTIALSPNVIKEDKLDPRAILMHEATHTSQPWWKRAVAPYHKPTEDKLESEAMQAESQVKARNYDIDLSPTKSVLGKKKVRK